MKNTFIYTISHNNKIRYIGKSNNPEKRLKCHIYENSNSHKGNWLKSIIKSGDYPTVEILDEVPIKEWQFWEQYWIEQFKQWGYVLLNVTNGGEGAEGYSHTEKTKQIMRELKLGGKLSKEHKKKISDSIRKKSKENPNYNRGLGNSRIPMDKDLLYHQYITLDKSMPQLSEHFNVSEKKIYDELKIYNIKKEKGWWLNDISKKYKKVVLQYDLKGNLIKEWDGIVDINKELKYNKSNIANNCRGIIKTSNGFIWRYKNGWIELPDTNIKKTNDYSKIFVNQYDKKMNSIKEHISIKEAAKENKLRSYNINLCCEGKFKSYGGFIWKYV